MASTYSTNLGIELMGTGDQSGTWGTTTNTNLGTLLEQAIAGYSTQAVTDGSATVLTITNGASSTGRNAVIFLTGALTADRVVEVPAKTKLYVFKNTTTGGFNVTVKVTGQTGVTIANGKTAYMFCNATDTVEIFNAPVTEAGTQTLTNKTLTAPTINTPTTTGGTINNTVIGGTTAAAGTFTTIGGTTITASVQFSGPHNGTVGATTPATGSFTTLAASSTVSGTGFSTYLASPPAIGGTTPAAVSGTIGTFATNSATTALNVTTANATQGIIVTDTGTGGANIKLVGNGATTPSKWIRSYNGNFEIINNAYNAVPLQVSDAGNLVALANVTAYSDERVKTNWRSMEPGFLKQLSEIKAGTYDRTDTEAPLVQVGVSAQDLQKILGPAVLEDADGMLSVAYGNAALVAAVELCKEVQRLHTEIELLKTMYHEEIGSMKIEFREELLALKARPVCKCAS
jgi:hypothetical protein